MNRLKSLEFWCVLLLMVNVATAGVDFYFRRSAAALEPYPLGHKVAGAPGITVNGSHEESGRACHLVRYASTNCGYCAPKYSQPWNELEKALTDKGCDSIIVSPYARDLPQGNGTTPEQKLAGVSAQFIRSTRFNSTPITLLLDRDWKVVWAHIGVVELRDSQEALKNSF
jgi:hypothetical protein